jgi:hypothetical protein
MNLFDAPAWAEALLGNKVTYPSFGTMAPMPLQVVPASTPAVMDDKCMLSLRSIRDEWERIGRTQSEAESVFAAATEDDLRLSLDDFMRKYSRKKPGPKPGSKRKVKE